MMSAEVAEIPAAAARFLDGSRERVAAAAAAMRAADPRLLVTVARGSSDHAATYLKYAVELAAGVPVASVGPSVASIYGRRLRLDGAACLGISQSGQSPDIVEMMRSAGAGGALTVAITNVAGSPMAAACDHALPLQAGPEKSVAATKTFVASVLAALALVAEWREDDEPARRGRGAAGAVRAGARLRLGAARRPAGAGELGLRARARPGLRDRQRDGAEVQGDLRDPRRELLGGRGAARAGGDRAGAFPGAGARRSTTRRCRRWSPPPSGWRGRGRTCS